MLIRKCNILNLNKQQKEHYKKGKCNVPCHTQKIPRDAKNMQCILVINKMKKKRIGHVTKKIWLCCIYIQNTYCCKEGCVVLFQ